jgi:asparagine N-glycosylation enzyme membrane subunit Stt3
MTKNSVKPIPGWIDYVSLFLIAGIAVILRSLGQIPYVFLNGNVLFREADPYYQMRLAENMSQNGLRMLRWDYFAQYPDGAVVGYGPIISWTTNIIGHILSSNPSVYLIDMIGAWLPPVAMGLICVVVYFLGKEVFNSRFVGLFGAALVAIIPSELIHRSLLGFTDHHILEVLFSCLSILCLIKTIRLRSWLWGVGFVLSFKVYCFNWIGWSILAAIILGWVFIYLGIKYLSGKKRWLYFGIPIFLIGLGIILVPLVRDMAFSFLSNTFLGFAGTIQEAKPVSPRDFYLLYGISGVIAFSGIYLAVKNKINSLFLAWAIFFIIASIAEKRWGYYSTIGIGLFVAYAIQWVGTKVKTDWKSYVLTFCCLAIIFTTYPYALGVAKRPSDISPDWYQTCIWLRENTPEPFNSQDAYYSQDTGKALYGVFTWWDYGHYIIQIGHRVPVCSPTQQETKYYSFFTEDTEDEANYIIRDLDIKYVIIDEFMVDQKFYAIWDKVKGTSTGWEDGLNKSMIYKMYFGKVKSWILIRQFGGVKIYGRL